MTTKYVVIDNSGNVIRMGNAVEADVQMQAGSNEWAFPVDELPTYGQKFESSNLNSYIEWSDDELFDDAISDNIRYAHAKRNKLIEDRMNQILRDQAISQLTKEGLING